jgi:hypothetical protein
MRHWIIDTACDEHIVFSADYFVPGTTKTTLRTVRIALATQSADCIIGDIDIVLGSTSKAGTPTTFYTSPVSNITLSAAQNLLILLV